MPRGIIATNKDRIKRVSGDAEIADGLWLIPHKTKRGSALEGCKGADQMQHYKLYGEQPCCR